MHLISLGFVAHHLAAVNLRENVGAIVLKVMTLLKLTHLWDVCVTVGNGN